METRHFRHVILGAGAVGSAAAYHLARRGEPVVVVEQFGLGHDRGSSHGAARIIRHSYADPAYARLMPEAFRAWRELEADAGQPLFLRTGGISVSPAGGGYVNRVTENLAAMGLPHRRMSGSELKRTIPVFGVPDDSEVVFEPDAGMLAARRILEAEIVLARHYGGEKTVILENSPVRRIDLEAEKPTVETDTLRMIGDRLIVAAGPWLSRLLPSYPVPLQVTRQQVLYIDPPDAVAYGPGRLPVFIYKGHEDHDAYYGMPTFEGLGVKVARHGGPVFDPDQRDPEVGPEYLGVLRSLLGSLLPALADAPIQRTEVCLYTMAPDDQFHVGTLADRPDVIVASACSGHGFKFSTLIGRVLADLATCGETDLPIDAWRQTQA